MFCLNDADTSGFFFTDPAAAGICTLSLHAALPICWLPAAMVAPTPVSALLHAVAVVKAGVFTVVKVLVYIFGLDYLRDLAMADVALYLAGFTILMASIIALRQDNLKRRLAYSTVSQLSYVILGALILSPLSTMGAALHIAEIGRAHV